MDECLTNICKEQIFGQEIIDICLNDWFSDLNREFLCGPPLTRYTLFICSSVCPCVCPVPTVNSKT